MTPTPNDFTDEPTPDFYAKKLGALHLNGVFPQENRNITDDYTDYNVTTANKSLPSFMQVEEKLWHETDPKDWKNEQIIGWILSKIEELGCNINEVNLKEFRNLNGQLLMCMSEEEFKQRDERFGSILYQEFQQFFKNDSTGLSSTWNMVAEACLNDPVNVLGLQVNCNNVQNYIQNMENHPSLVSSHFNTHYQSVPFKQDQYLNNVKSQDYQVQPIECMHPQQVFSQMAEPIPNNQYLSKADSFQSESTDRGNDKRSTKLKIKRRVGRPATGNKKEKRAKINGFSDKLWKFMRDLLQSPQYNPRLIRWENAEDGVFRIVESGKIAQLWGMVKNNEKMNYEKMSRALRQVLSTIFL
ncbi:ETS factor [Nymphon striatum]|nr:ETS factor [Nymphon striatum]